MTAEMKVGTWAEARLIFNAARLGNIEHHLVTLDFEPATGSPYRFHQLAESNRRKSNRGVSDARA
jgi:hypothetical protein